VNGAPSTVAQHAAELLAEISEQKWFRGCADGHYYRSHAHDLRHLGIVRELHQDADVVADLHMAEYASDDGDERHLVPDGDSEPIPVRYLVVTSKGRSVLDAVSDSERRR
jgi:hypothetical protein